MDVPAGYEEVPDPTKAAGPPLGYEEVAPPRGTVTSPISPPTLKPPQVEMQRSALGRMYGGPTDIPPLGGHVPKSIQKAPDYVGEGIAGLTALGAGAMAADAVAPVASAIARPAFKLAKAHPIASTVALEAAKHIPYIGSLARRIPSYAPLLLGSGEEAEGGAPIERDATRSNAPYAGEDYGPVAQPRSVPAPVASSNEIAPPAASSAKAAAVQSQIERGLGYEPVTIKPGVRIRDQFKAAPAPKGLPEGHTSIESSALQSYKYDPTTRELEVLTKGGGGYIHGDVSQEEADAFANADSKGKAWQTIRGRHPLVGKLVNGQRTAVKPGTVETPSGRVIAKSKSGNDDLTQVLQKSLEQARLRRGRQQ